MPTSTALLLRAFLLAVMTQARRQESSFLGQKQRLAFLDPRLRGDDSTYGKVSVVYTTVSWIPACAGMTVVFLSLFFLLANYSYFIPTSVSLPLHAFLSGRCRYILLV